MFLLIAISISTELETVLRSEVCGVTVTSRDTYVSSPDLSRQISASCTAALRSSVSSDAMSPVLALLFLPRRTDSLYLDVIYGIL